MPFVAFITSTISLLTSTTIVALANSKQNVVAQSADHDCGYPNRVRDGLHPYQYFSMAKVYANDFRLDMAKICVEKLKKCEPADESMKLAGIVERCYLPKYPVPPEAVQELNKVAALLVTARLGDNQKREEERRIYQELTKKYPNFEWPYFLNTSFRGGRQTEDSLKKVLSINPNNVTALIQLSECCRGDEWSSAYQYAKKALELDPGVAGVDVEFFREMSEKKKSQRLEENNAVGTQNIMLCSDSVDIDRQIDGMSPKKTYEFIDKTGKTAFQVGPRARVSDKFSDGLLLVNGRDGVGWGQWRNVQYWDKAGKVIIHIAFGDALSASEGLCAIETRDKIGRTVWGFIDHQGKTVVQPNYQEVLPFRGGLSACSLAVSRIFFMDHKWGFIDRNGTMQVEPIYDHCLPFSDDLAGVTLNGKVAFINKKGFFVIPPSFDYARSFSDGLANVLIWNQKDKTMTDEFIDKKGKIAFSSSYTIEKGEKLSSYFRSDEFLFPDQYEHHRRERLSRRDTDFHDHLLLHAKKIKDGIWRYGFLNEKGDFVVPPTYVGAAPFSEGLARVYIGGKYGFIDRKGAQIIPPKYKNASDFSDGVAAVSTDGKVWGYIDRTGRIIVEEKYLTAYPFAQGLAKVELPTKIN